MGLSAERAAALSRLAEPVRVHRELSADGRESLYERMWEEQQGGATEREIAAATGLSKSHVHRLLVREAERRQVLEEAAEPAGGAPA